MSKRSSSSSPTEEHHEDKKIRLESPATDAFELVNDLAQEQLIADNDAHNSKELQKRTSEGLSLGIVPNKSITPKVKSLAVPNRTEADPRSTIKKTTRKAGEGFTPWKPKPAHVKIPDVQPHWGIVPRPGGYDRPSEPQPPARTSDGAIRPALWEDRKGAVRLKRGSRYINGYDQAYHMWLPLMDVRPISAKKQQPRRIAVGYYYPHGMLEDWNDIAALNDLNKALQEAIKSKSNKEAPFHQAEREILAKIFAEDPDVSMLDAAERFNELAHPETAPEEGRYPKGRFTESIQHEFRNHRSSYIKGEAPTDKTEKEIPLEMAYKEWKAGQAEAKKAAKGAAIKTTPGKKATKKASSGETVSISKKRKSRSLRSDEELSTGADATFAEIVKQEVAGKAAKAAAEVQPSTPAEAPGLIIEEEEEEHSAAAGEHDSAGTHSSSPDSVSTHSAVTWPSYDTKELTGAFHTEQVIVIDHIGPELAPPAVPEVAPEAPEEIVDRTEAVAESTKASSLPVQNLVRNIKIDESYDDEDELL
ncbi:hypothetical protein SVAN01_09302 [Stagonosporopsis vannaccii]|nr:hypothetical protein SVAN01_09302 [Stagonosporopsis vannaccii]